MEDNDLFSAEFQSAFAAHLATSKACGRWMAEWIERLETEFPDSRWRDFKNLNFDDELSALPGNLAAEIKRPNLPEKLCGLWFGLYHPIVDGQAKLACYVWGSKFYAENDDLQWAREATWKPAYRRLPSKILQEIYSISYKDDETSMSTMGEYAIGLMYAAALAITAVTNGLLDALDENDCPVVVGFDAGGGFKIGSFRNRQFVRDVASI
jgi:hypothetical protein